ncbi:hypothetical protein FYZ48_17335 [Gimesia chilikensis]|uniref:hypothetical protein n=1 Tax=Gimesia chilikensis TaxID=2605989 RepID=UPI0011ED2355|nr:hypothetical protein [Gimesia chilikensis]KAA0135892.1 hypothetical protein FYZ48_17335 [Gimesia chilikensis]
MKSFPISRKQYCVFLVVFSLCALLGVVSLVVAELYMPRNPGGMAGRAAMFRSMGLGTLAWLGIALWSGAMLWITRQTHSE